MENSSKSFKISTGNLLHYFVYPECSLLVAAAVTKSFRLFTRVTIVEKTLVELMNKIDKGFDVQASHNSMVLKEIAALRNEVVTLKIENSREFSAQRIENSREFSAVRKEMEAMKLEHTKESSYVRIELEMIKNKIEYSRRLPARKFTRRSSKSNRK